MTEDVCIRYVGNDGAGVAYSPAGVFSVPFTLPSERVLVARQRKQATLIALKDASKERVSPRCRHFGACGGCVLQHWEISSYQEWKRSLLVAAIKARGISAEIAPLISGRPFARRRLTLHACATPQGQVLGFHRYRSGEVIDIEECPIAHPAITEKLPDIRALCAFLLQDCKNFDVTITLAQNGLDVAFGDCLFLSERVRQKLVQGALACGFLRLSVAGEVILEQERPHLSFNGVRVDLPPANFLQASHDAEKAMVALVVAALSKSKNAVDLFSGLGTFSFSMAKTMQVYAIESDGAAVQAFARAAREARGLKPIRYSQRDLFRRPLLAKELSEFDAIVFDPPRAGAEKQTQEIAKTKVPKVVAVSCNPLSLARDLEILVKGGYQIEKIVPIDQFLWSPHLEIVAVLHKRSEKRGWKF
ncbi:class I SAM-dependent RNA methyltransferase [Bartonella sp. DGB2]|uniref:class I SAM-dependent RNA methyltransferase n=1 Tax=Bartonella sp. DGB2 TaxID=3388426 RepID=UPI0039901C45